MKFEDGGIMMDNGPHLAFLAMSVCPPTAVSAQWWRNLSFATNYLGPIQPHLGSIKSLIISLSVNPFASGYTWYSR